MDFAQDMPPFSDDFSTPDSLANWRLTGSNGPITLRQEAGALVVEGVATQGESQLFGNLSSQARFAEADFTAEVDVVGDATVSEGNVSLSLGLLVGGQNLGGMICQQSMGTFPGGSFASAWCSVANYPLADQQPTVQQVPLFLGRVITFRLVYSKTSRTIDIEAPALEYSVRGIPIGPSMAGQTLGIELYQYASLPPGGSFMARWLEVRTTLGGGSGYVASRSVFEMNGISYSDAIEGVPGPLYWTGSPMAAYKDGVLIPELDGAKDVNGYLVTASASMLPRPLHFTMFSPLSRGELLAAIPVPPEITVTIDAEFPSVWRHHGYGNAYEFVMPSVGGGEPPVPAGPHVVSVVPGYNPVGFLRPIPGSDQPLHDTFSDKQQWSDGWVPHTFATVPQVFLQGSPIFFGVSVQPGSVMQSAGALFTEHFNGFSGAATSRYLAERRDQGPPPTREAGVPDVWSGSERRSAGCAHRVRGPS